MHLKSKNMSVEYPPLILKEVMDSGRKFSPFHPSTLMLSLRRVFELEGYAADT